MLVLAPVIGIALAPDKRAAVKRWLWVCLVGGLPLLVWAGRNQVVLGQFTVSTQTGVAVWVGNSSRARGSSFGYWWASPEILDVARRHPRLREASEPEKSAIYLQEAVSYVRAAGLRRFVWLEARKLALFLLPIDSYLGFLWAMALTLPLVPLGVWAQARSSPSRADVAFNVAWVLSPLLTTLLTFHEARYRFCAAPALLVFAYSGWGVLFGRVRTMLGRR